MRILIAIPVYNEEKYVSCVIACVLRYASDILVVDDGSTDATPRLLRRQPVHVIRHERNLGYGRALRDAFEWAQRQRYDWVVTMDCDEQHEPAALPRFSAAIQAGRWDVISGSRYMTESADADSPPPDRRRINALMTDEINARLGLQLTDAFCGYKAHRVAALERLTLTEDGYAFPMQFWPQAAAAGLRIRELPVRLIYNDPTRTFGGPLNDPDTRLTHYRQVLHCEIERVAPALPAAAALDLMPCGSK